MSTNINILKHAYCIIAHQDSFCLESLICLLDYDKNDIFLLLDKKSDKNIALKLHTKHSRLIILPEEKRIDIRWGGMSQIKAELTLFKEAVSNFNYSYIHLLSGADLPLKPQKDIHRFFNNLPEGSNVIPFSEGVHIRKNVEFKTMYYHAFVEYQRFRKDGSPIHFFQDFLAKIYRKSFVKLQKIINYKRDWSDIELKKGSNWVSISSAFANYLVEQEKYIMNRFKGVLCPDEIFLHTMIYNSKFKYNIIDEATGNFGTIRYIDWERGTPYTWKENDFQELLYSEALFARKFSSVIDKNIIQKIKDHILAQQSNP